MRVCYGQKTLGKETNVHRTKMTTPLHLAFKLTVEMSSVFFLIFLKVKNILKYCLMSNYFQGLAQHKLKNNFSKFKIIFF